MFTGKLLKKGYFLELMYLFVIKAKGKKGLGHRTRRIFCV